MNSTWKKWTNISLIERIIVGLVFGAILGVTLNGVPVISEIIPLLGALFVEALKSVAPMLVFFLVMSAVAQHESGHKTNMKHIIVLYLISTFVAATVAVVTSFIFPIDLALGEVAENTSPEGIGEVINTLLMNIVDNPISALYNANYIGILSVALVLGLALKNSTKATKLVLIDISNAVSKVVKWIIELAPFGIMGLVFTTVSESGLEIFITYSKLLAVLVGSMLFVAFVTNPLIVYFNLRQNPYPLVLKCLRESGVTAFFTRSSAANIPVNMKLCEDLGLDKDTYSVSIPLGATINMAGAAITINTLTLAAANTLGISVSFTMALLLSVIASVSACGASGVAGGSLLLIPLACSLFGIPNDVSMQVVAIGFLISVIQDSCETALNSSTDALLTATAEFKKKGRNIEVKY